VLAQVEVDFSQPRLVSSPLCCQRSNWGHAQCSTSGAEAPFSWWFQCRPEGLLHPLHPFRGAVLMEAHGATETTRPTEPEDRNRKAELVGSALYF